MQVVANARALDMMRQQKLMGPHASTKLPPSLVQNTTPGGPIAKEAAARPWVLNVDAMLSDFLSGKKEGDKKAS